MKKILVGGGLVIFVFSLIFTMPAMADSVGPITFELPTYKVGDINGQDGWMKTGPYDVEVVSSPFIAGAQSLRISNARTSGSFGDQTFSRSLTDAVGEAGAGAGTFSIGTLQNHFETEFEIKTTKAEQQPGLFLSVSPDRGDGSRMSYLGFSDESTGINVIFYDVQGENAGFQKANFVLSNLGTLDRTSAHDIKLTFDAIDGPSNDKVKVWIDGVLKHEGTSWENYYRFDTEASEEQKVRAVRNVLFRVGGTAFSATAGQGYLIDNLSLGSSTPAPLSAPILNAPVNNSVVNGASLTNSWSSVDGATKYVYESYNDSGASSLRYHGEYTVTSKTATNVADGVFWWRVRAKDTDGNLGPWSELWKVTVDSTKPSAPIVEGFLNPKLSCGAITNIHSTTVDWTDSTDANGVSGYDYAINYPLANGSGQGNWQTFVSASQYSGSLNEGIHTIKVRAKDNAGNYSEWSNECKITADWTAPNTEITLEPANPTNAKSASFEFIGSDNFSSPENLTFECKLDEGDYVACVSLVAFTNLALGTHKFYVRATDQAGNIDSSPDTHEWEIVRKVPTSMNECKNNEWKNLFSDTQKTFRNQGDCMSWIQSNLNAKGNKKNN